jgi:Holliday junction resolvase
LFKLSVTKRTTNENKMVINVEDVENSFTWETFEDGKPYLGTYKMEIPNRVKMMTRKLDLVNWVKIDKTYASQQREKERLLEVNSRIRQMVNL